MNKPYHARPDWILKSIVYFCDNYTIDGEDLRKYKRGAIAWYKKQDQMDLGSSFGWDDAPQGYKLWMYLYGMQSGTPWDDCKPWTDYEKRKIAKMPRVK
jgi:hypothetical protein